MKRVAFVAGATGYTGREVVRALAARGVETWAHVRPDSPKLAEWKVRFEADGARVDATPWELTALTDTLRRIGVGLVFGLLGTTAKRGAATGDTYESVDYGLTAMLIKAAVASGTRPRFVYLSSLGAAPGATGGYLKARWRAEEHLRESGLSWTIARPSFVTGSDREESRPMERIGAGVANAGLGLVRLLGARRTADRYRSMTGAQLAEGLVRSGLDPEAESQILFSDQLR